MVESKGYGHWLTTKLEEKIVNEKIQMLRLEILSLFVEPFTEVGNTEKCSFGVGVKGR